ncbi:hypothetical protein [Pandoraea soli]
MSNTSDFSKPQTTDTYVNVTAEINALTNDLAKGLDPATTTPANTPTNAVRWNSANGFWEKFTGTTWGTLASVYNIVVAQASKLKSAVTIAITGDVSGSTNFDGSGNVSITATLPTVNANAGTAGSAIVVPVITTNAKGQVTAVIPTAISFPAVPVTSVFGRTGAVTLASSDVTGALGYSPPQPGGSGASGTWPISVSGNAATASKLISTAGAGTYNWSGQGGQPSWLWGSNDGTNFYVWNPSNFSVNYANSAGSAPWAGISSKPVVISDVAGGYYGGIAASISGSTLIIGNANCNCNCNCGC